MAWLISALLIVGVAPPATGFHGHVTIGPLQPVCSTTKPCDGPAARVVLRFTRSGRVRSVRTDAHAGYRIVLPRGPYTVTASRGMSIHPSRVWAHGGIVAKLDFRIDTGIR